MKILRQLKNKKLWIAGSAAMAVLLLVLLCVCLAPVETPNDPTDPNATQDSQDKLRVTQLLDTAKAIKSNLVSALKDLKQNDPASARSKLEAAQKDIAAVRTLMDNFSFLVNLVPQAESIRDLLDAADMAIPEILLPATDLMEAYPISALSVGDGFDAALICKYIDFAESVIPKLDTLLQAMNGVDLSLFDSNGEITKALDTANQLLDGIRENPKLLPMFKTFLGGREDRFYLIAVQNPSEIRASGGFPGSFGTLRIEDGILTLGEFETVTNVLSFRNPQDVQITGEEMELFNYLSGIYTPRDADLCPDFERVGHIWASSYQERHGTPVSGVISVTPHIVQRLLAVMGQEIQLSDGFVLSGENATQVLIHDIYFKYFTQNNLHPDRHAISDGLFAEAAQKTMEKLTGNISLSQLMDYLPVMKDSIADRTLMLWMRNEEEQAFVMDMGWSGGLNKDPQNPQAGIYFNCVSASKMGWFLLMDTEIGEPTKNADGSHTYPITVTFTNNISQEEIRQAGSYISGGLGGAMRGVAYFFAPAGGSVDNFATNSYQPVRHKTYNGMTLGFMDQFLIKPNEVITVTYTVTTAPGVDAPLTFSKTPTAQQS